MKNESTFVVFVVFDFVTPLFIGKRCIRDSQMLKTLRKSKVSISKLSVFVGQKSISRHYFIQNAKDRIVFQ